MALISHIPASELVFENGNRKFFICKIIDFSEKKSLIFDGAFSQVDGIFWHFEYIKYLHDFWELSKTAYKTCLAQLGPILEEISRKLGP